MPATVDEAKALVYQVTNNAQMILGYMELHEATKALQAAKESIRLLENLKALIGTPSENIGEPKGPPGSDGESKAV